MYRSGDHMDFPRAERKVAVSGHQEYWRGWLHGFAHRYLYVDNVMVQETLALVEDEQGNLAEVLPYKIKFLEPIGKVEVEC